MPLRRRRSYVPAKHDGAMYVGSTPIKLLWRWKRDGGIGWAVMQAGFRDLEGAVSREPNGSIHMGYGCVFNETASGLRFEFNNKEGQFTPNKDEGTAGSSEFDSFFRYHSVRTTR